MWWLTVKRFSDFVKIKFSKSTRLVPGATWEKKFTYNINHITYIYIRKWFVKINVFRRLKAEKLWTFHIYSIEKWLFKNFQVPIFALVKNNKSGGRRNGALPYRNLRTLNPKFFKKLRKLLKLTKNQSLKKFKQIISKNKIAPKIIFNI